MRRFKVKLKAAHEKTGLSPYAVHKATGIAQNTVRKYVQEEIIVDYIPMTVVALADFYGVDWRDPEVVEVIETDGEAALLPG